MRTEELPRIVGTSISLERAYNRKLKTENESLRMRNLKIDQGVPRQKLCIRNLKLEMQNDQGIWEEVYDNVADIAEAPSA